MKPCPCHSGKLYSECCQLFHDGALPQNALQLMRSRYAAYALQLPDYLINSTHPTYPGMIQNRDEWRKQILHFCRNTRFDGLQILEFQEGSPVAYVTFFAKLSQKGRDVSFTEKSRFEKVNDKWFYQTGELKI